VINLPPRLALKLMIEPMTGCWLWLGAVARGGRCGGYGNVKGGRNRAAHRVVYEAATGIALDRDTTLDHVQARGCASILCCNPDHLEPVSRAENNRRSSCWKHAAFAARMGRAA
jgi:hypothetical protein